jgi:hypothetical protein
MKFQVLLIILWKRCVVLELGFLASNIIKKVCGVSDFFFLFLKKYEEKKAHYMLFLMLNPKFKNLDLVSSFIGLEQSKSIVEEYDRKTLYPMLLKCYHHLHPLFKNPSLDQHVDENYILDIFEMIANTNELM